MTEKATGKNRQPKARRRTPPRRKAEARTDRSEKSIRQSERLLASALTAAAVLLYASFWFHAGGLSRDEVNSWNLAASSTIGEIWRLGHFDSFPMLWPLLLRAWPLTGLASTDLGLRALGLLAGIGMIAVLWQNARSFGYAFPLLTLALLGLNAEFIRWTAAIRAYGIGAILLLLAFRAIWQLFQRPGFRQVMPAACAAILSVQALYHNAILLGCVVLGAVVAALRRRDRKAALLATATGAAAALSLLPYLPLLARTDEWNMLVRVDVDAGLLWEKAGGLFGAPGEAAAWIWLGLCALSLLAAAMLQSRRLIAGVTEQARDLALYGGTILGACVPAYLLFLKRLSYPTESWYYIPLAALAAACAETIVASLPVRRATSWVRVVMVLIFAGACFLPAWRAVQAKQTDIDLIAARIASEARSNDFVVVNPWFYGITFARYYHGPAPWSTVPPLESLRLHRYDLLKDRMSERAPIQPVLSRIAGTLRQGGRVWVVGGLPPPRQAEAPPDLPPPPLEGSGWSVHPYMQSWTIQSGFTLWRNGPEMQIIRMDEGVYPIENPPLMLSRPRQDPGL